MALNIKEIFSAVDAMNAEGFVNNFLAQDVVFNFANAEPLHGRTAVLDALTGFFSCIKGIKHDVHDLWNMDDATILTCTVEYVRLDGQSVSMPAAVVMKHSGGELINSYSIYVDQAPLWAA